MILGQINPKSGFLKSCYCHALVSSLLPGPVLNLISLDLSQSKGIISFSPVSDNIYGFSLSSPIFKEVKLFLCVLFSSKPPEGLRPVSPVMSYLLKRAQDNHGESVLRWQ